jgi:hypothetical protein
VLREIQTVSLNPPLVRLDGPFIGTTVYSSTVNARGIPLRFELSVDAPVTVTLEQRVPGDDWTVSTFLTSGSQNLLAADPAGSDHRFSITGTANGFAEIRME